MINLNRYNIINIYLKAQPNDKGKPVERQGRKAKGLRFVRKL